MNLFEKFKLEMDARGFSPKTKKTYLWYNSNFLKFTEKQPEEVDETDVKKYISYLLEKGHTKTTANFAISALKFFYEEILAKKLNIKRPKKEQKLPTILTKEEIKRMIESTENLKHKLLIEFIYATGARVSEAVKIKINDVLFEEGIIIIRGGKGAKDRQVMLPEKLKNKITEFLGIKNHEDLYLFSSQANPQKHISIKTAQLIIKHAAQKAGIKKRVSCHTLRHSFATHLLESGVDIRIIQKLLGHQRITATQIYTQISNQTIKNIRSPIEDL